MTTKWTPLPSRVDKPVPASYYAQVVAALEKAFPDATLDEGMLEALKPFFDRAWRSGAKPKFTAAAHCSCDGKRIVPSPATQVEIQRGEARPPKKAAPGKVYPPDQIRPKVEIERTQRAVEVARLKALRHLQKAEAMLDQAERTGRPANTDRLVKEQGQVAALLAEAKGLESQLSEKHQQQVMRRLPLEARGSFEMRLRTTPAPASPKPQKERAPAPPKPKKERAPAPPKPKKTPAAKEKSARKVPYRVPPPPDPWPLGDHTLSYVPEEQRYKDRSVDLMDIVLRNTKGKGDGVAPSDWNRKYAVVEYSVQDARLAVYLREALQREYEGIGVSMKPRPKKRAAPEKKAEKKTAERKPRTPKKEAVASPAPPAVPPPAAPPPPPAPSKEDQIAAAIEGASGTAMKQFAEMLGVKPPGSGG